MPNQLHAALTAAVARWEALASAALAPSGYKPAERPRTADEGATS